MFSPHPIGGRKVVNTGQVLKLVDRSLTLRDSKFVFELSRGGDPNT
jgi:hypothetical protein